ncbi:MAG: sugar transferase [Pleurocapsa minor GSE-CHR-MK-17-07R]|nr:sugar transferase [Pleurocapsa minor GSE-CHR-MK 17-07R]
MTPQKRAHKLIEPTWLMPALDIVLAFLAFILAYIVRYQLQLLRPVYEFNSAPLDAYLPYAVIFSVLLWFVYRGAGLYKAARSRSWSEDLYTILNGVANATVVLMAISFVFQPLVFSRLLLIYAAAFTVILLALARIIRRTVYARLRARGIGVMRALVIGVDDTGRAVLRTMIARKELGYVPLGFLDDNSHGDLSDLGRVKALGDTGSLADVLREQPVDAVVITLPWSQHDTIMAMTEICQKAGVEVSVVPDLFQLNLRQVQFENMDGIPLLRVNNAAPFRAGNRLVKRVVDVALVVLAAPVWLLIFGLVALAIRLEGPGSIFYSATRVGENGRPFKMIKFRSMIENADAMRSKLVETLELDPRHPKIKDDPRITRVGRFIRRTSIDELPNLINVLTGQMSLVGPRPPTPDEVELYAPWHRQRLQVKPGMTGLWQVNGRSEVPFDEMCLLDIYYIENWSMGLDAQILMMTIPRVILRSGAY